MAVSDVDALLADIIAIAPTLHSAGAASPELLRAIAGHLRERRVSRSAETGAGATTLLLSHLSGSHTVFALDDGSGSVVRVRSSLLLRPEVTTFVEGPTQKTLPTYRFEGKLQAALLDGPHAFPFPQLEYYYIYPHLETGALLILDDIHLPSIYQLYRFLAADEMFELLEVVDRAAFFQRTSAPVFDPFGDGWERQGYNRRLLMRYVWLERLRESIPAPVRSRIKELGRRTIGALRGKQWVVRVLEPQPRDPVGSSSLVRGTARIHPDTYLWLLARRKDQNGWWPQGGGSVDPVHGEWAQQCRYGEPSDAGQEFEIALVVVDAVTNRRLERWVEEGRRSGEYPPIPLPQPTGCPPVKVTVRKIGG